VILIVKWRIKIGSTTIIRIQASTKPNYIHNIAIQAKSIMKIENQKKIDSNKKKRTKTKINKNL
jgi:hypothetical protein